MYERFAELLEASGKTAYRVATDIGLSPVVFTEWKKGKSTPKIDKLKKIANYFGVPIEALIGD